MKNIGLIIVLIGILVIAIPALMNMTSNLTLSLGLVIEIVGLVLYIIFSRKVDSTDAK